MKKKISMIILCLIFLTGCWDRKELNEIGVVLAVALDKDFSTGEIILSCQVVRPNALKKEANSQKQPVEIVSEKGYTVFEAIRNISKKFDRKVFFSHNKIIIISEQLAKEGVTPILDTFARDPEPRLLEWIVVAKNMEARDVLGIAHGIENLQAIHLNNIIKFKWSTSEVSVPNFIEFYKKILNSGIDPVAGAMEGIRQFNDPYELKNNNNITEVKLSGTAVFNVDKLVGYLDDKETRGLNWITGKVKSSIINIPGDDIDKKLVSIEILHASSKIKPQIKDGKVSYTIEVKEEGNIGEVQDSTDVLDLDMVKKLENQEKKVIEKEVKMAINKAQKDFCADIFGFGKALSRSYPKEWSKMRDDWQTLFSDIEYKVDVTVKLRRLGKILNPVEPVK